MTLSKYQVFLASNFEEFETLRHALKNQLNGLKQPPIEAIDLNDNAPDTRPPLSRSYFEIDKSELVVLLIGDTYGGKPPNSNESYAHLEYRYALSIKKPILPFVVRNLRNSQREHNEFRDSHLKKWVDEIRRKYTTSCLDVSVDPQELAATIFEQIRDRLVEIYFDGEFGVLEAAGNESELILEESIIKRDRLASAPGKSPEQPGGKRLLESFANEHACEALKALQMGLPDIAIHHLGKALDMVRLDVVLGYWLARLLVPTGRQKPCEEGRRIALRAVQISAKAKEEAELETMVCLIIAARASERMGEFEVGREYARQAHEKAPYHWLTKLEYGRQLALADEKNEAFKLAEEAFWLRPESINKVQSDAAFHRFGRDFNEFRARLRQKVTEEVDEIYQIQRSVQGLSLRFGIITHVNPVHGPIGDGKVALTQMVRSAKGAMKGALLSLQHCALKLTRDNDAFVFNSSKGLTPETRTRVEEEIARREDDIRSLSSQLSNGTQKEEQLKQQRLIGGIGGLVLLFLLIVIGTVALLADATAMAILMIVLTIVELLLAWPLYQSMQAKLDSAVGTNRSCHLHLQQIKHSLGQLEATKLQFAESESRLRINVAALSELINRYEVSGLKRLPFSPAPPIDRKDRDDLMRADTTKIEILGLTVDAELLPPSLRFLSSSSGPEGKYWLARRVISGANETWSRSAAYFQPKPVNNIYLHKDGQQTGPFTAGQIRTWLNEGSVGATDYAWYEGAPEWILVSAIPGL